MRKIYLLLTGFIILILTSCSVHDEQPLYTVQPPLKNITIIPNTLSIDATKEQVVRFPNGVSIEVPADAFCDEEGKPIKGNVELSLQTYDSKAAILASGIPMKYTENGVEGDFESAGMFKLEGRANNKKIEIREDKKLQINYPSKTFGDFDFYYFEEEQVKQSGLSTPSAPDNATGSWKKLSVPKTETVDPGKVVKTFQLQFDSKNYTELQPLEALKWNLATTFMDPTSAKNKWALNQKWTSLEITQPKWGLKDPVFEQEVNYETYIKSGAIDVSKDGKTVIASKKPITTVWSASTKQVVTIDQIDTDFQPIELIDNRYMLVDKENGCALYTFDGKQLAVFKDSYQHKVSVKKQRVVFEKRSSLPREKISVFLTDFSGKLIKEFKLTSEVTTDFNDRRIYADFLVTPEDLLVTNSLDGIKIYDLNGNLLYGKKEGASSIHYFSSGKLLCEDVDGGLSLWDYKQNKVTKAPEKDFSLKAQLIDGTHYLTHLNTIYNTPFIIVHESSKNHDSQVIWDSESNTSFRLNFYVLSNDSSLIPEIIAGKNFSDRSYHVYNLKTKKNLITIPNFQSLSESYSYPIFSKDKKKMLIDGYSHIQLYDVNGRLLRDFKNYDSLIIKAEIIDNKIFTISSQGLFQFWDLNGQKIPGSEVQLQNNENDFYSLFSNDVILGWSSIFNSFNLYAKNGALLVSPGRGLQGLLDSSYVVHTSEAKKCVVSPLFNRGEDMYQLTLRTDSLEFFTYVYLDKQSKELISTYNSFKAKRINSENDRRKEEVKFVRRFELAKFGLYNWDKVIDQPNRIAFEADFKFDIPTDFNHITIFMITELNGKAVIKFYKEAWRKFSIDPTVNNKLVAVLPDNRIALFTNDDLKKINWEEVRKNKKYSFQMKSVKGKIESLEMLESYL
jgi:hypothetical protein